MSTLLAVAAVAVATTPISSPAPLVKTVTDTVFVTPPDVIALAQMLALAGGAALTSVVHQIAEKGKWSGNTNRLVLLAYSAVGSVVFAWATGKLGWNVNGAETMLSGFLVALGSASGRYELSQFLSNLLATPVKPLATDENAPA